MRRMKAVGRKLMAVGRAYEEFQIVVARAFLKGKVSGRVVCTIKALDRTMEDAQRAFEAKDFDRVEFLIQVVQLMLTREASKFAADPNQWIDRRRELGELRT